MGIKKWLTDHAALVARPGSRREYVRGSQDENEDGVDSSSGIIPKEKFFKVPYFIIFVSIAEILTFLCHTIFLKKFQCIDVGATGPAPLCSVLIYNPYRRVEVWRLFTYLFVHSGYIHIASNIFVQVLLGLFLEIYHGPLRIALVYAAGGLTGSLLTSVTDPNTFLAGASAGSYAIILAHVPFMILNFREMGTIFEKVICLVVPIIAIVDFSIVFYNWYNGGLDSSVGYAAHLGGAAAGLLVGMTVLRNLKGAKWESILMTTCFIIWTLGIVVMILINSLGGSSFYPPSNFEPIQYCFEDKGQTCTIKGS